MTLNTSDNFQGIYDGLGLKYEAAFGHDPGLRSFIERSLSMLAPQSNVLDVGSGTGKPTSQMVVASGHRLVGIDYSTKMIEISREQVPAGTFEHVNMLDYNPEGEKKFDAAFTIFSLFHFDREQMSQVFRKWQEWIAPGGYVFIGTMVADDCHTRPEMFASDGLAASGLKFTFMGNEVDVMLYTKAAWVKLLGEVGFEIQFTEKVDFHPPAETNTSLEPHFYIAAKRIN